MKNHINLLLTRRDYAKAEKLISYFKLLTIFCMIALSFTTAGIFFLKYRLSKQYEGRLLTKERLIKESLKSADLEASAVFVNDKAVVLKEYLSADVNFLPYYRVLREYLPTSTDEAQIKLIIFDNSKNAGFEVSFTNYDSFLDFLKNIESSQFLDIFERLTLDSFSASERTGSIYSLNFIGKFKPINEN